MRSLRPSGVARRELAAGLVAALCFVGTLLTLERSVWMGAAVATVVTLISFARLRRVAFPVIVAGAAAVLLALVLDSGPVGEGVIAGV